MEDDGLQKPPDTAGRHDGLGRLGKAGLGLSVIAVLGLVGWALTRDPAAPANTASAGAAPADTVPATTAPATTAPANTAPANTAPANTAPANTAQTGPAPRPTQADASSEEAKTAIARVLDETESVWSVELPKQAGKPYEKPAMVLFTGRTPSACGTAQAASGPFYCPRDRKLYLDTAFFAEMQRRYAGSRDFAFAYVIAHEVGHHIQALLGLPQAQPAAGTAAASELPLRRELMADCLAGAWANHMAARQAAINMPDIRQAARTATSIGAEGAKPDAAEAGRAPMPDSFALGTAEQRTRWLSAGIREGTVAGCNTLEGPI